MACSAFHVYSTLLCAAACLLGSRLSEYEAAVHVYTHFAEIVRFFYHASYGFL